MLPVSLSTIFAILVRPWFWLVIYRFKPNKGFFPSKEYTFFRIATMYGRKIKPPTKDVLQFLNWCRKAQKVI